MLMVRISNLIIILISSASLPPSIPIPPTFPPILPESSGCFTQSQCSNKNGTLFRSMNCLWKQNGCGILLKCLSISNDCPINTIIETCESSDCPDKACCVAPLTI